MGKFRGRVRRLYCLYSIKIMSISPHKCIFCAWLIIVQICILVLLKYVDQMNYFVTSFSLKTEKKCWISVHYDHVAIIRAFAFITVEICKYCSHLKLMALSVRASLSTQVLGSEKTHQVISIMWMLWMLDIHNRFAALIIIGLCFSSELFLYLHKCLTTQGIKDRCKQWSVESFDSHALSSHSLVKWASAAFSL